MRSLRRLPIRTLTTAARCHAAQLPEFTPKQAPPSVILKDDSLPIEKKSLSRGMSLNKFEKDFMIYPEYTETKDLENIKEYISRLGQRLDLALDKTAKNAESPLKVLNDMEVFATFVHRAFGGMSFCHKDSLLLAETLASRDLSMFLNVDRVHMASRILEMYGTVAQREKYLPKIASGQCKPAMCFMDDTADGAKEVEVVSYQGYNGLLEGKKVNVINAEGADIFFVVARNQMQSETDRFCYILEKSDNIVVSKPKETQGLQGTKFSDVEFKSVVVSPENIVGDVAMAPDIVSDYLTTNRTFHASAVVGFLKKLSEELTQFANANLIGFRRMSETPAVQSTMSDLAMNIFILETVTYYLGGLDDENLFLLNDIEHSIIQRIANRTLRQGILTTSEIAGFAAVDSNFDYDKKIRDAVTLMALSLPDLTLVRSIALPIVDSYVKNSGKTLKLSSSVNLKSFFTEKLFLSNFKNPMAIHFIAEHAHPSLEKPCRELEENTWRLNNTLEKICKSYGCQIKEDYYSLNALATIIENNLGMLSLIARTSRSYSIGLKNSDLELGWAFLYCNKTAKDSYDRMVALQQYFEVVKLNPSVTALGKAVMEAGGYPIENPLSKNW